MYEHSVHHHQRQCQSATVSASQCRQETRLILSPNLRLIVFDLVFSYWIHCQMAGWMDGWMAGWTVERNLKPNAFLGFHLESDSLFYGVK